MEVLRAQISGLTDEVTILKCKQCSDRDGSDVGARAKGIYGHPRCQSVGKVGIWSGVMLHMYEEASVKTAAIYLDGSAKFCGGPKDVKKAEREVQLRGTRLRLEGSVPALPGRGPHYHVDHLLCVLIIAWYI